MTDTTPPAARAPQIRPQAPNTTAPAVARATASSSGDRVLLIAVSP